MKYGSMFERLIANSEKPEHLNENGCWLWLGPTSSHYGIVAVRRPGKRNPQGMLAHREMEKHFRGLEAQLASDDAQVGDWWDTVLPTVTAPPMCPDDETLDHTCCTQRCINPDHWQPVDRVENSIRRWHARA